MGVLELMTEHQLVTVQYNLSQVSYNHLNLPVSMTATAGGIVYTYNANGNKYYSKDVDGHNGGNWKVFEKNGNKLKRIGTADKDLNIFKN